MKHQNRIAASSRRGGTTILEVIISIGVLLFGLVGLAAIIPAASQLARNSVDFSRGSSIGVAAASNFEAAGLNVRGRWTFTATPGGDSSLVCIDPLFLSRPGNLTPVGVFRADLFPYFIPGYNPLTNPAAPTDAWPVNPAWRLARANLSTGSPTGVLSYAAARRIFDDENSLVFEQPDDETLPRGQIFRNSAGGGLFPAARQTSPQYSWFSTVQPTSGSTATASIVVVKSRDRVMPGDLTTAVQPFELAERMALVHQGPTGGLLLPTGFSNGAGGNLTLVCSSAVSSEVPDGSWVMLMQADPSSPTGARHAWFRIVQSDPAPSFLVSYDDPVSGNTLTLPGGEAVVWGLGVTLEGPDWLFDTNGDTVVDQNDRPTVAVLINDAVSVIEFPVRLR